MPPTTLRGHARRRRRQVSKPSPSLPWPLLPRSAAAIPTLPTIRRGPVVRRPPHPFRLRRSSRHPSRRQSPHRRRSSSRPCRNRTPAGTWITYPAPGVPCRKQPRNESPWPPAPAPALGAWGIQVGAFANLATAQAAAENARTMLPELLRTAKTELPATTPFGGKIAFRARLVGLSPAAATDACSRLSGLGLPCLTVSPRDTF